MKVGDLVIIRLIHADEIGIYIEPDESFPNTRTIVLWDGERFSIPTFQLEGIND